MRFIFKIVILSFLFLGCNEKPKSEIKRAVTKVNKTEVIKKDTIYSVVNFEDFLKIRDTTVFIKQLRDVFKFGEYEFPNDEKYDKITVFKKVKIYGSVKTFYFIEYDFANGSGASFPWKNQFLLSENGKPFASLNGIRYEFINFSKRKSPYLMVVNSTYKGNGGHEIFKITNDTIENVFDGFSDYFPKTYDIHEDNQVNSPDELNFKILDKNKDNLNDIMFYGHIITGTKKTPVNFVFIYDKKSGHFVQEEDYSKKYSYLESLEYGDF